MGRWEGLSPRGGNQQFGVIGSPIAHSLSPLLHRTAYAILGRDDVSYDRYEVPEGGLSGFLRVGPGRDLAGASITMPCKPEAFALADLADETSARLGVCNTLIRLPDARIRAENHDVHGIVASLRDHGVDSPSAAGVLGSGATALSAVAALLELGVEHLLLCARTPSRLAPLQELVGRVGTPAVTVVPWARAASVLHADVVVSALALPGAESLARSWLHESPCVAPRVFMDVLYEPWPTPLARVLGPIGAEMVDGLEMLVHQADMQLRSMLRIEKAPRGAMLTAARGHLASLCPPNAGSSMCSGRDEPGGNPPLPQIVKTE